MFRDIFFVLVVLSITMYAHNNKNDIVSFIEVSEEEEEDLSEWETSLYYKG